MKRLRRLDADGTARGRPFWMMRLALIAVAIGAMTLDGCSFLESNGIGGGCGSCGGLGGLRRTRIFFRRRDPGGCCGGAVGGTVIEGAAVASPGVIVPGAAPLTPLSPATPAEPAGTIPDLSPADEPAPTSRSSGSSPAGSGTNSTPANSPTKSGYTTTYQSRSAPNGGGRLARTLPNLEPTPRSAPGRGSHLGVTLSENLVDNLPPPEATDTPPEPTQPSPLTDAATVAKSTADSSPAPEATGVPETASASEVTTDRDVPVSVAVGIAHFQVVDRQLAGGSYPSAPGLAWLAEKSYRTILDLREPGQVHAEDFAAVAHQGLRQVYLPVAETSLDGALIKRFEAELAAVEARPLYFCDADGSRAALLWYIHRVTVDHTDRATALRDAEALGPLSPSVRASADAYLETLAPRSTSTPASTPAAAVLPTEPLPLESRKPTMVPDPTPTPTAGGPDSTGWHSYAALAATALGVPFAYWGCNTLSLRGHRPASLPAPVPRSKALPPSSDV